jgi:hypothetical protein
VEIDIVDNAASKSSFSLHLENDTTQNNMRTALQTAVPNAPEKSLFFSIKSKPGKAQELKADFEKLIETLVGMAGEFGALDEAQGNPVTVGANQDTVFVLANISSLGPLETLLSSVLMLSEYAHITKLECTGVIASDMTLKGVVGAVKRSNNYDSQEEAEKLRDETNLYRLFLSGLGIKFSVDCLKESVKKVSNDVANLLGDKVPEKTVRFLALAARGFSARIRFSKDNSLDLLMDFLNSVNPDVPDGADLIDEVGMKLSESNWVGLLQQFPFLDQFVDALKGKALCDVKLGLSLEKATLFAAFKTEGIFELYDTAMQGMEN